MSTFTQAHLTAIEEAIAGGYLEVRYDDKVVKYQSMSDLLKARTLIASKLSDHPGAMRISYITTARDYE
jgi:hypothetical protein